MSGVGSRGGVRKEIGLLGRVRGYFAQHARAAVNGLSQIGGEPFASFLTAAVIGMALALPAGLQVFLHDVRSLVSGWQQGAAQISLYLEEEVSSAAGLELARQVEAAEGVAAVHYISRDEALAEFRSRSGFSEALSLLEHNPLPAVIVVTPAAGADTPGAVRGLLARLQALPEVDFAQFDLAWLERLHTLLDVGTRAVHMLSVLLALGVLLIVGNTIRLAIQNRRDEIEIAKLIGATDAFVRRPFLYRGLWYGLCGGILAWALVYAALWVLNRPIQELAALYGSGFQLGPIDVITTAVLLGSGALLGFIGTWLTVARHLRATAPP